MPSGFIVTYEREAISENATMSARSSAALLGMLLEAVGEHPELRTELAGMLRDEHPSASAVGFIDSPAAARRVGLHPDTLVRFAREARVPGACKAGRGWRFPADLCPADIVPTRGSILPAPAPARPGSRRSPATAFPSSIAAISGRL